MRLIIKLIICAIGLLVFLFIGLQILAIFYVHRELLSVDPFGVFKLLPVFDFSLYQFDNNAKLFFYMVIFLGICSCFPLLAPQKYRDGRRSRWSKSKYEKTNYAKFMTKFQRIRGTQRIQYDDQGEITRNTFEVFCESVPSFV